MSSPNFSMNYNPIFVDAVVVHAENKPQNHLVIDLESDNETSEKHNTMNVDVGTKNETPHKQNYDFLSLNSLHASNELHSPLLIDVENSHGKEKGNTSSVHGANDQNSNMVVFDVESDSGDNQEQNRDLDRVEYQREVSQEHNLNFFDVEAMHGAREQQISNFIDLDPEGEATEGQNAFVSTVFVFMHTYHMEFDDESRVGKLPACFGRELGDILELYVMLQDPSYNEFEVQVVRDNNQVYFTDGWYALKNFYKFPLGAWISLVYVNPRLLLIRLTTRGGTKVNYPIYNPPVRHLVARIERTDPFGSSVMSTSFNVPTTQKKTFVRGVYKNMDFYDIYTETLTLPWEGFGQFVFKLGDTNVDLVDCSGDRYPCKLDFGGGPDGKFACRITEGWVDLRRIHKLAPGDKVRFSVTEPDHNSEVYVSFFPAIVKI